MTGIRELGNDEISDIAGGEGIGAFAFRLIGSIARKAATALPASDTPSTPSQPTETSTPKSASFDPVTIRF